MVKMATECVLMCDRLSLLAKVSMRDPRSKQELSTLNVPTGVGNAKQEASIGGSVAAAHYIRSVAPLYGVPVILHTARERSLRAVAVVIMIIGSLREKTSAVVRWHGKIRSPIPEFRRNLRLNNLSLTPTRLTSSSTKNLCSPPSTFPSSFQRLTLILYSMIDLSEEEKEWNISTTAKVRELSRLLTVGINITSISNERLQ